MCVGLLAFVELRQRLRNCQHTHTILLPVAVL